jgi:hypothetical protein
MAPSIAPTDDESATSATPEISTQGAEHSVELEILTAVNITDELLSSTKSTLRK